MAGRLCSVQSLCTIIILELALMLGFWVGDYLPPFFTRPTPKLCDVTNSSIVRKLVQKNWSPILHRYGVSLPLECPLNLSRDIHGVRQSIKSTRSSHWQCLQCGKKFYFERHLDLHIERRHTELINKAEDSVCFGDFCDIMRCDVLMSNSFLEEESKSTDVSIWTPSSGGSVTKQQQQPATANVRRHISYHKGQSKSENKEGTSSEPVEHCDEAYYAHLRKKCADLVWDCLQGLISVLDAKDFKTIQSELESVSCSYLSCSRYGDKCCSPNSKVKGKLRPFFIVFGSLFISLCLALAYYFTWIYTQRYHDGGNGGEEGTYYEENDKAHVVQEFHEMSIVRKGPLLNRTTHL